MFFLNKWWVFIFYGSCFEIPVKWLNFFSWYFGHSKNFMYKDFPIVLEYPSICTYFLEKNSGQKLIRSCMQSTITGIGYPGTNKLNWIANWFLMLSKFRIDDNGVFCTINKLTFLVSLKRTLQLQWRKRGKTALNLLLSNSSYFLN